VLVLLDGEVPDVPGVSAVTQEYPLLLRVRVQTKPRHANILPETTLMVR
jgi:hypothetical protein